MQDAPVITAGLPGSFARSVFHDRHPAMVRQIYADIPCDPSVRDRVEALLAESTEGVVGPLDDPDPDAPDRPAWAAWTADHLGAPWGDRPFLWAESYFFRRLLGALGYFAAGPLAGVDPFAVRKEEELHGESVAKLLTAADALPAAPDPRSEEGRTYDAAMLRASLWGNRGDLAFRLGAVTPAETSAGTATAEPAPEPAEPADALVADDTAAVLDLFAATRPGSVHLVADNAAGELASDLLLLDHLLATGRAERAVVHLKPHPYYVSDATPSDAVSVLRRMQELPGAAGRAAVRFRTAMEEGRAEFRSHRFFCAPFDFRAMPGELSAQFGSGSLTILKGDLNYRRLVGDRYWPPTTPFAERAGFWPGPVAALRVLKSDVVTGVDAETVRRLDGAEAADGAAVGGSAELAGGGSWRTAGAYGLVQLAVPRPA